MIIKKEKPISFCKICFNPTVTQQPAGTIPALLEVVEVDEKFSNLAKHLLGNVFIATDDAALHNSNDAVRYLEKTGKVCKRKICINRW